MNFFKNLQTDFGQTEEPESGEGKSILATGSTLFDSMKSKTGNLVSDFSNKVDLTSKIDTFKRKASIDQFGQAVKDLVDISNETEPKTQPSHIVNDPDPEGNNAAAADELDETIEPDAKRFPLSDREDTIIKQQHENPFNNSVSRENSLKERPKRPPPPRSISVDSQNPAPLSTTTGSHRSNSIDVTAIKRKAPPPPPSLPTQAIANLPLVAEKIPEEECIDENDKIEGASGQVEASPSSASEYGGDDGDDPCYENDKGKRDSVEDVGQRCIDGIMTDDPDAEEILRFMTSYVPAVVNGEDEFVTQNHSKFMQYIQSSFARTIFAKYVDNEANLHGGQLGKIGQDQLLSHMKSILDECQKSEDFAPAKKLLTVSLVYYHDVVGGDNSGSRIFLFTLIKTEGIWHTLKFWNACFFQSVQEVRAKILEQNQIPEEIEKAVAKQLRSYLNTMYVFSLHPNVRLEFLRKQGELFNLSQDEMLPLREMILERAQN